LATAIGGVIAIFMYQPKRSYIALFLGFSAGVMLHISFVELLPAAVGHVGALRGNLVFSLMYPVRCFSCGSLVGDKWDEFSKRVKEGEDAGKVLDSLSVKRYCCRRMLLAHVEIIDENPQVFMRKQQRIGRPNRTKGDCCANHY
jgi:DNA-directed RNA polymerase subunit N